MNTENKQETIIQLIAALTAMLESESENNEPDAPINNITEEKIEFLTIKECTKVAFGLSEHTIRQLVAQNKVKYIRTGQGKRGKILINKQSLLNCCNNSNH